MKEHPEYKYRPRRKPKPLLKKDGSVGGSGASLNPHAAFPPNATSAAAGSKYNLPLHFFPPGFDPSSAFARTLFPHFNHAAILASQAAAANAASTVNSSFVLPNLSSGGGSLKKEIVEKRGVEEEDDPLDGDEDEHVDMEEDHDELLEDQRSSAEAVSYTHLTLPTTPYV